LEEKKMTKIFMRTLSSFYYERMIASSPSDFTEMVNMGMRLEEGVREGCLSRDEASTSKRYDSSFSKKKDSETNAIVGGRGGLGSEEIHHPVNIIIIKCHP
jgi:hypothetical protein